MTSHELTIRHFAANAKPCQKHRAPVTLQHEGGWFIACEKGCLMHDREDHASPAEVVLRHKREGL